MFTQKDIANYYNSTQNHYIKWWNLSDSLSLHYGIWEENTKSFKESLINTNMVMMNISQISSSDKVLDAGCGVGGAAMYLASNKNVNVVGISLSEKQVHFARHIVSNKGLEDKVTIEVMDYTRTIFADESFDVVWACESMSSAPDHILFINEAYRILKKGGRMILSDFFLSDPCQSDPRSLIRKWIETWGVNKLIGINSFEEDLINHDFENIRIKDYTDKIKKSSRRMYYASLLGALPSEVYNLFNPNVSRFARSHYKCGYYQYKALKKGLWRYKIIITSK